MHRRLSTYNFWALLIAFCGFCTDALAHDVPTPPVDRVVVGSCVAGDVQNLKVASINTHALFVGSDTDTAQIYHNRLRKLAVSILLNTDQGGVNQPDVVCFQELDDQALQDNPHNNTGQLKVLADLVTTIRTVSLEMVARGELAQIADYEPYTPPNAGDSHHMTNGLIYNKDRIKPVAPRRGDGVMYSGDGKTKLFSREPIMGRFQFFPLGVTSGDPPHPDPIVIAAVHLKSNFNHQNGSLIRAFVARRRAQLTQLRRIYHNLMFDHPEQHIIFAGDYNALSEREMDVLTAQKSDQPLFGMMNFLPPNKRHTYVYRSTTAYPFDDIVADPRLIQHSALSVVRVNDDPRGWRCCTAIPSTPLGLTDHALLLAEFALHLPTTYPNQTPTKAYRTTAATPTPKPNKHYIQRPLW